MISCVTQAFLCLEECGLAWSCLIFMGLTAYIESSLGIVLHE
jgi:hypothetical protein